MNKTESIDKQDTGVKMVHKGGDARMVIVTVFDYGVGLVLYQARVRFEGPNFIKLGE